jgi:hypothetical protein
MDRLKGKRALRDRHRWRTESLGQLRGEFTGVAAAAGLVLYFVGAMVTVLRARWYANLPFPLTWLALTVASFALCLRVP